MIRIISIFVILSLGLGTSFTTQAQTTENAVGRMLRTDCSADVQIDFIRYGTRASIYSNEGDDRVWLKFVNKTRKKTLEVKAKDDQLTLDFLKQASKELGLYHDVVQKENCESADKPVDELPEGYTRREVYYTVALRPGESFEFSVARQYLSEARAIYISYSCLKKCGDTAKTELKKAYFFSSDLPPHKSSVK